MRRRPPRSPRPDTLFPVTTSVRSVRGAAVYNCGRGALSAGEPVANLRRKFVPIWLLHRYQVEAAAKLVGGVDFSYSLRGDGLEISRPVPAEAQRRAFDALLATLSPEALTVPEGLIPLLSSEIGRAHV